MALGYGAVYELRDLPKAVRRKFISKLPSLKRLLVSRSRGNITIENARPTSSSEFRLHLRSSVTRTHPKYFSGNFLCNNDLIIPMHVICTVVKVFEDYDLPRKLFAPG